MPAKEEEEEDADELKEADELADALKVERAGTGSTLAKDANREFAKTIIQHALCELICGIMIFFTVLLVIFQTDATAGEHEPQAWWRWTLFILNLFIAAEIGFRIYAFTIPVYFRDAWNCADFLMISMDISLSILEIAGDSFTTRLTVLRMFRIVKIGRAIHKLESFEELHLMMKGLASAIKSMFWGLLFCVVVLLGWSIIATPVIHPLNKELDDAGVYGDCDRCGRAFKTVAHSFLTFTQQVIAGDSWGDVTVPLVEYYPWTGIFFGLVLVSINLVVINMILAAVCDAATQSRLGSMREVELQQKEVKRRHMEAAKLDLVRLCAEIDLDCSGNITSKELNDGAENNSALKDALLLMGVQAADLEAVFGIMDADGSGEVDYKEFADELLKMKSHDQHTMLAFIKHYVVDIRKQLSDQLEEISKEVKQDMKTHMGDHTERLADHKNFIAKQLQGTQFPSPQSPTSPGSNAVKFGSIMEDIPPAADDIPEAANDIPAYDGSSTMTIRLEELKAAIMENLREIKYKHDSHAAALENIHQNLRRAPVNGTDAEMDTQRSCIGGQSAPGVEEKLDTRDLQRGSWPPRRCCLTDSRVLPDEMPLKSLKPTPILQRV